MPSLLPVVSTTCRRGWLSCHHDGDDCEFRVQSCEDKARYIGEEKHTSKRDNAIRVSLSLSRTSLSNLSKNNPRFQLKNLTSINSTRPKLFKPVESFPEMLE
ncbi:hypothetical protein ANTRET_LOCUS7455 [Anthophora retusa]